MQQQEYFLKVMSYMLKMMGWRKFLPW